jgi:hypothetical protein
MIEEKLENTRETGHNEGGVNETTTERRPIVWSQRMEELSDERAVKQWNAVHEEDEGMEDDTGEGREEREGGEGMAHGGMEVGVEKGKAEVIEISEEESEYVLEGREKETGIRVSGHLKEDEEVTGAGRGSIPKRQKTESGENGRNTPGPPTW